MDEDNSTHHPKDPQLDKARRLPRFGRRLLKPRTAAAVAVVAAVALNASGAFGLNVLGLHSALTATSLPVNFQSAPIANYGFVTPTATTCSSFNGGNAGALGVVNYSVKSTGSTIFQTSPGVFYYFSKLTTGNNNSATLVEIVNNPPTPGKTGSPFFAFVSSGSQAFDANCNAVKGESVSFSGQACPPQPPGLTPPPTSACYIVNVTGLQPNTTYIIGIKYQTSSTVGDTRPAPPPSPNGTATYFFNTYQSNLVNKVVTIGALVPSPGPPIGAGQQMIQFSAK
jgi:hypothetical protein